MSTGWLLLLFSVTLVVSACTNKELNPPLTSASDPSEVPSPESLLAASRVVSMIDGGFLPDPGYAGLAARHHSADTPVSYNHVLRAGSPGGPVDLVRYVFGPDPIDGRTTECFAVVWAAGGGGMACPSGQNDPRSSGTIVGGNRAGELTAIELRGPDQTTHFLIATPTEVVEVHAIDGMALFVAPETPPCSFSYTVEVWDNETFLERHSAPTGCKLE